MATYQFKTNIQCEGCIAKVTPFLNQIKDLENWQVDTKNPEKILTIQGPAEANINVLVTEKVKEAGYQIEPVV